MQKMIDDMQNNGGYPQQVDTSSFKLGENMAATKGEVVFRNELIELIAYEPQTEKVLERPLICRRRGSTNTTSWISRPGARSSNGRSSTVTRRS